MLVCEKLFTKEFTASDMKEAYLKCCKWYASHVIAVNNSNNVLHKIEKVKSSNIGLVRLNVYVCADESEIKERHCEICQEVSGAFFMSKNKHMCESCKMLPYRRRLEEKVQVLRDVVKGVITE